MEQTVASLTIENSGVIIFTCDFDVLSYQYGPCTVYITIAESLTSVSEVNFTQIDLYILLAQFTTL